MIRSILAIYQMKSVSQALFVEPALRGEHFQIRKSSVTVFVHENQGWGNFAVKGHRHLHRPPLHQRQRHRPCRTNHQSLYL